MDETTGSSRSVDLTNVPEYTVRNDGMMKAFRDLFYNDDQTIPFSRHYSLDINGYEEEKAALNIGKNYKEFFEKTNCFLSPFSSG